jgi:hypothetical protein
MLPLHPAWRLTVITEAMNKGQNGTRGSAGLICCQHLHETCQERQARKTRGKLDRNLIRSGSHRQLTSHVLVYSSRPSGRVCVPSVIVWNMKCWEAQVLRYSQVDLTLGMWSAMHGQYLHPMASPHSSKVTYVPLRSYMRIPLVISFWVTYFPCYTLLYWPDWYVS